MPFRVDVSMTSTCARAWSEVTHHYSAPEATLAADHVGLPCHLQNCYYHASDLPVVPLWHCRVCFGRLERTPTSLLHDSSRSRQTKQDAVRKACLLSGRLRHNYGTVSPPPSVPSTPTQPSVVPSRHICSAQHLTITFYININIVMHNRSIFNLYDWALWLLWCSDRFGTKPPQPLGSLWCNGGIPFSPCKFRCPVFCPPRFLSRAEY